MIDTTEQLVRQALGTPLESTDFPELGSKYSGKVRDNYSGGDGRRTIVVTDRISAFDRILGTLPLKGQLLNAVAAWWFDHTRDVAPNHVLSVPDPNVMVVRECTPLPVEMVVRHYLTGTTSTSIWVHYQKGERTFCGHPLPNGMRRHQRLPTPILTPSTKGADGAHDISASREEILRITGMDPADFDGAAAMAMALFEAGRRLCAERGLILVDTKYEFGKTPEGELVVIDEIHTPDSSRFWFQSTYEERFTSGQDPESFDKEYVRRFLAQGGFMGDGPIPPIPDDVRVQATLRYMQAVQTIMGVKFEPVVVGDPVARIRRNLGLA
jgi:phosphoribosylaminoimidazole-succinocarboxamide synthase